MTLLSRLGNGTMSVPSHASDDTVEATWPWHNVTADDHTNVTSGQISM
jgi:hypothetical protein